MQEGTIGRRYARALSLALEGENDVRLKKVEEELSAMGALLDRRTGHPAFRQAMLNPSFSPAQRRAVLKETAQAHSFDDVTVTFLQLLVEKERVPQLPSIARAFRSEVDERVGRVRATVTTARALDSKQLMEIVQGLEKRTGKKVLPDVEIDESVLAGVRVKIGGFVYDSTVKSQLDRLRADFRVQ